ncbi:MAG TPA: hypothetical protein VEC94_15185 [Pseudolabrys sp.]|jgi:hypothetical protein|nr:hypothetical protein [Pseudolabrys sp.]
MSPRLFNILAAGVIAVFALASTADASKTRKHKKVEDSSTSASTPVHGRGYKLVPGPPLYFGDVYLGSDPDPNIRFQILRDISGRLGGDQ